MEMNATAFYSSIRNTLFGGKMTQGVVDTINAIFDAMLKYDICDYRQKAYVLATAYHESYHATKNPQWDSVREGFTATNAGAIAAVRALHRAGKIKTNYAVPERNNHSYYGRGFVQITWPANYIKLGARLNIPLYDNPDLALERDVAAELLVVGMKEGLYTGRNLNHYINTTMTDFVNARRIINGLDKAQEIANHANKFYNAIIKL